MWQKMCEWFRAIRETPDTGVPEDISLDDRELDRLSDRLHILNYRLDNEIYVRTREAPDD